VITLILEKPQAISRATSLAFYNIENAKFFQQQKKGTYWLCQRNRNGHSL